MKSAHPVLAAVALIALCVPAVSAQTVENSYRSRLTSAAFTPAQGIFEGDGNVTATIEGRMLTINGEFHGLESPVTRVRLLSGIATGAPTGASVMDLRAAIGATSGAISGELRLSSAQMALLRARRLYVQVETKAAPEGALWGWLMPNHRFPGEKVPEKANWYAQ